MRGIGAARYRIRPGFPSWIGETGLVQGLPGMRLRLSRTLLSNGGFKIALVRKAAHFDGLLSGRFEFLIRVTPDVEDEQSARELARALLSTPVTVPLYQRSTRPLGEAAPLAAWLWSRARVKRGAPMSPHVRAGRPFLIMETEHALGQADPMAGIGAQLTIVPIQQKLFELFLIYPDTYADVGRKSPFRDVGRTVRTYVLRLLQDVETISLLCGLAPSSLEGDVAQQFLNEYTRHVIRGRRQLHLAPDAIVDYCYAAFARLTPGRIDGLRAQITSSTIRPNVKAKLLNLLDDAVAAHQVIANVMIENYIAGDNVMGDKFENIDVSGQGVAIGRGAQSRVSGSNYTTEIYPNLAADLKLLADAVISSGRPDAEVESLLLKEAAKKAEEGDEGGVMSYLGKAAKWTFELASTIGAAALSTFLTSKF
jgi:hypothetical protein